MHHFEPNVLELNGQPDQLQSLWQQMKAALRAEKHDWQVWTIWYDDRLDGYVRDERRELAYMQIDEALWDQGPAIVNAEIKRRIEELEPPQSHTQEPKRSPVGLSLRDGFSIPGQSHTQDSEPSPVPEIPPQLPAALEPVWSNGKLVLPSDPASTDGDPDALVAALKVLRAEIADLADERTAKPILISAQLFISGVKLKKFPSTLRRRTNCFVSPMRKSFWKVMRRPSTRSGRTSSRNASML